MNLQRVTLATASSVLVLAALAACGSDSGDDTATLGTGQATDGAQAGQGGPGQGMMPGASGTVAAVSGKTAQVQSDQSGQVAVSWTGGTTFTEQVDGTLDDVTVGSCVAVTTDHDSGSSTEVAATTVRVVAATDGGCGFPGVPGGSGRPQGAPSNMPSNMPSDMPNGARAGGFGTIGEVTALSSTGFTVAATLPNAGDASASSSTSEVSVTVSGDTTYTTTTKATASAVEVGVCVNAQGESDDTGAVTATSISVSKPVDGECTSGLGIRAPGATS